MYLYHHFIGNYSCINSNKFILYIIFVFNKDFTIFKNRSKIKVEK